MDLYVEVSKNLNEFIEQNNVNIPLGIESFELLKKWRPNLRLPDVIPE